MRKVLVSISLIHASSRDVLSGIFQHLESGTDWNLKVYQNEENPLTAERLSRAEAEGAHGLIVTELNDPALLAALYASQLPIVAAGLRPSALEGRRAPTYFVHGNSSSGALGADYLNRLGNFRSFAFLPAGDGIIWSRVRERAFHDRISSFGKTPLSYVAKHPIGSDDELNDLAHWLTELPKPAAVMAACDWRAAQALTACENAGLEVPGQLAFIGVDNDEFVCLHSTPPLSSIIAGHKELGLAAAQTLDRLMSGRRIPRASGNTIPVDIDLKIVERNSSRIIPPMTVLVERAKQFIRNNACRGIGVGDVVTNARVSRRLLELRFRAAEGETIRSAIERVRLDRLRHLLRSTTRPLEDLAAECGFSGANALAHLFRKRMGMSMREFRVLGAEAGEQRNRKPTQRRKGQGPERPQHGQTKKRPAGKPRQRTRRPHG